MNTAELDRLVGRVELFVARGLNLIDAIAIADKLLIRDRDGDDRRICLECSHLSSGAGSRRCSAWRIASVGDAVPPDDLVRTLQRCHGFKDSIS